MLVIKFLQAMHIRTNIGNQSVSSIIVVGLWQDVPASLKNLKTLTGNAKEFLFNTQFRKKMIGFICAYNCRSF